MMNDEVKEFLASIPSTRFFQPDRKPLKKWRVCGKTLEAAKDAAREAAGAAAGDAAWEAAVEAAREAARDAERNAAWRAAWNSAWDAAWAVSREASRNAALDAAWEAAWDAALLAGLLALGDLDYPGKGKHLQHARDRWRVWEKGYCLLCDVDGVLYVYHKEKEDRK